MLRHISWEVKKKVAGLRDVPQNNKLGVKVYKCLPRRVWGQWFERQTAMINEFKLDLSLDSVRQFLFSQLESLLPTRIGT